MQVLKYEHASDTSAYGLVVASTALTSPSLSSVRGVNGCMATRPDLCSLRGHLTATPQTAHLGLLSPRVQQHPAAGSQASSLYPRRSPRLTGRKLGTGTTTSRANTSVDLNLHLIDGEIASGY
jgi:hypothetical protein